MRSVTEQPALDEFLLNAELAGTDFTAEKLNNVKIVHRNQRNPHLLPAAEESATVKKQNRNRNRLKVPRRPPWTERMSREELDVREREAFMEWRRGLAELQSLDDLLMTPFERNLEIWRQLWRVVERSDLVVQIVDARNPLLFRCEDLESYVRDVDSRKNNLLLINKADMMTSKQRESWARYLEERAINFRFFSAELAMDQNEADASSVESDSSDSESLIEEKTNVAEESDLAKVARDIHLQNEQDEDDQWASEEGLGEADVEQTPLHDSTRIITTEELESLFLEHAPEDGFNESIVSKKTTVGLVGYPNVGKSSTINSLIGAKKVSVSATPGKTKHFQTIHLSDSVILCDCPGLVFPNFATTKAELVCNGVLPIDHLREYTGPAALVAQRIPQAFLEAVYGLKIQTRPLEEGGTGIPTGEELLQAYATARGFATTGQGQPDESRAARYVLKDYVKGKLLFCHPPPSDSPLDPHQFNRDLYDVAHLPQKRRAALPHGDETVVSESEDASLMDHPDVTPMPASQGEKSQRLDQTFFRPGRGSAAHMSRPRHQQYSGYGYGSGKPVSGRKLKAMVALKRGIDPSELEKLNSKKHFKGKKKDMIGEEHS